MKTYNNNTASHLFTFIEILRRQKHSPSSALFRLRTLRYKRQARVGNSDSVKIQSVVCEDDTWSSERIQSVLCEDSLRFEDLCYKNRLHTFSNRKHILDKFHATEKCYIRNTNLFYIVDISFNH